MRKLDKNAAVEPGSGNVFADLGLRNSKDRLVKAQLANRICEVISARGLTQEKAAQIMGLDQPKISALRRGRLKGFSAERLFRCLNDLGQEIEITIHPVQKTGRRGAIHVVPAAG